VKSLDQAQRISRLQSRRVSRGTDKLFHPCITWSHVQANVPQSNHRGSICSLDRYCSVLHVGVLGDDMVPNTPRAWFSASGASHWSTATSLRLRSSWLALQIQETCGHPHLDIRDLLEDGKETSKSRRAVRQDRASSCPRPLQIR